MIETAPLMLAFAGRTAALREFLNRLSSGNELVAVDEIAVEPAPADSSAHGGKSAGAEPVALVVQPALSRFVVTVEFCELVAQPAAAGREVSAAAVQESAGHTRPIWQEPAPQKRGRGWIYGVFTPPAVFCDRRSGALAAVPAEEAMPADARDMPVDLQLLQVRRKPFRLKLVGFARGHGDFRGIFSDTATGKTVIGRAGDFLAGCPVRLGQIGIDCSDTGGKGTCAPVATATVTDEGTGEVIVLTTRGPSPAGAPWGVFASRKAPALQRELREGESAVFEDVHCSVERIELDPPLAVVTCVPGNGARAPCRVLMLQNPPDTVRGTPVLTPNGQTCRDHPTTP